MSQELTLEMVVGQPNVLSQDMIKAALAAAGYDEVVGSWSPDLEQTTDGLAILADSGSDNITIIPSKNDVYELVLQNDEFEVTFMVTAVEEKEVASEEAAAEETQPEQPQAPAVEAEVETPVEEQAAPVVEEQPKEPEAPVVDYTPPAASKEYDPDAEFKAVVNTVKAQLDYYSSKMHRKAMLSVDTAVRMQMKLLSTILGALSHGGRKTELALQAIMEEFSDPAKAEEVYKGTLINRFVDESFRTQKQRNLFKDLVTLLSIGSKVGRMKVSNHFDLRRLEANFDNPKHYSNLCTFFSVKD